MRHTLQEMIDYQEEQEKKRQEEYSWNYEDPDYYDYYSWIQEEYCGG